MRRRRGRSVGHFYGACYFRICSIQTISVRLIACFIFLIPSLRKSAQLNMTKNTNHRFQYWDEAALVNQLPTPKAHRYITFDVDQGGLNNIRLVFEYVVVLAAITGRTLVLPPRSSWYLINHGPMPEQHKGGMTHLSDIYDIDALAQAIPVIDTPDFIQLASQHLSIPKELQNRADTVPLATEFATQWSVWLYEHAELPGWNPYNTVIAYPTVEQARSGPHFSDAYLDFRTPVEFTPRMNAAPVLHFPSNDSHRSLGPVATMLASVDETLPILGRRLLKHHLRYRREIFELAETMLVGLGLHDKSVEYDAMQIRRNDFQYEQTQLGVGVISQNIGPLFDRNLPIYIATDENREEIFSELAKHLNAPKIMSWRDVSNVVDEAIPYAWIGPLEQLICTSARRFAGTDLSTFSSYIHRLRGYLPAPDANVYFHSESYSQAPVITDVSAYRGRDYLRDHPLFWQSC